jgi:ubiquinone/menaquinone biosynthesis C-methylase UbiE
MPMDYQSRKYALLNSPIEIDRHLRRVRTFLKPRSSDRVLEIGCGRGFLTERVRAIAPDTTGIDLNAEAVANGVVDNLRVMNAEKLDYPDETFDKIYSFHAIEHIPRLDRAFAEMARVLKPGGRILLVYPAEPIRGLYVVPTAIILFGNPLRALDIHIHQLTPVSLRRHFAGTPLRSVKNALHLLLTPQFVTVLEKQSAPAVVAADVGTKLKWTLAEPV